MVNLVHDLIYQSANRSPDADALSYQGIRKNYKQLAGEIEQLASGLIRAGLGRNERLAVYLEKRLETVSAFFAANAAGGVGSALGGPSCGTFSHPDLLLAT